MKFRHEPTLILDFSLADAAYAALACLRSRRIENALVDIREHFASNGMESLTCLTLRSAFDLYLGALSLEPGSEIMISAITHPEMVSIVKAHGLTPVPIDIDPATMAPRLDLLRRAMSGRSKAVVATHLFGGRLDLSEMIAFCAEHRLVMIEDCAQVFGGGYVGDSRSDAAFFSFGPIKTSTALGGAVACVRNKSVLARMESVQKRYPAQGRMTFASRVIRYFAIGWVLRSPWILKLASERCKHKGLLLSDVMRNALKSFKGDFAIERLRKRPSDPLVRLLARKLSRKTSRFTTRRREIAHSLATIVDQNMRPGSRSIEHLHWIFPVSSPSHRSLLDELSKQGLHAMRGLSNLATFDPPEGRPDLDPVVARRLTEESLLIPMHPKLSGEAVQRLAAAIQMNRAMPRFPSPANPS